MDEFNIDLSSDKHDRHKIAASNMAEYLKDHVYSMGWAKKGQARWNKAFELLIATHGESAVWARIKEYTRLKVLRPKVQSGDDFRNNWDWIGEEIEKRKITSVEVTQLTKIEREVVDSVAAIGWPEVTHSQIPGVVKSSIDNLRAFKAKLSECEDRGVKLAYLELVPYLMQEECLTQHFLEVHRKYAKWEQWSGDITSYVWTPKHEMVQRVMLAILVKWAGKDDGSWGRILELVK